MSLEDEVVDGTRAQRLLEDQVLVKAFDDVRLAIIERWESCPIRDTEGQHELKLMLRVLADVRGNIELAVHNGKLAAEELRTRNRALTPAQWRASNTSR
jgi:hypothetical protein